MLPLTSTSPQLSRRAVSVIVAAMSVGNCRESGHTWCMSDDIGMFDFIWSSDREFSVHYGYQYFGL